MTNVDTQPNRYTLLIIEDDDIVRDSLSLYFSDCGYNVVEAEDGEIGLARFATHSPDVVISDLKMPYLDGLSVLEAISEQGREVPFIVVSGAGKMHEAVRALRLGAHDYFVKPIADMEILELSIERAIEQRSLKAQNLRYRSELESANEELNRSLTTLRQDHKAALQIQRAMLPEQNLRIGEGSISHFWRPSLFVSGDFLDCFDVENRFTVFYLTDVSGHGAPAAFVTVFLKHLSTTLLKAHRTHKGQRRRFNTPNDILEEINRQLISAKLDRHATMFFGILDRRRSTLHYAVAGHLPLPILCRAGKAVYLQGNGMPLGLLDDNEWRNYSVKLQQGDQIVVCSDGVFELMKNGELVENELQLLKVVEKSQSVDEIVENLGLNETNDVPDDIAILLFQLG
ncbi:PP2C family protein-serine/threonine phosphatase [Umboniibacter marinipuniceus]|uniref:Serine phosphatase RsbU (Regulator of sigma subunit) n=1 Tax=Umboniibacter marinipuniceus TaxID=569599 RepID=A0A3M0A2L4_9GAMM|nr:SpoIIE family protein phosphatase [Umboniibacter marinipuniceus]RMA78886.1 serine phosphatase RsbU (regulator of sigma subunit) [Umboniibacter marinipuniceus]